MLWHPVRRTLGVRSFGTNAYTALKAGDRVVEEHREGGARHEELYLVLNGRATFELGDDTVEVGAGGMVFLRDPELKRGAVATEANTTVIAFGGPVGTPFEPQVWEHYFAAQESYDAGDFEEAYEIASEGLEEHGESARLHYNLACYARARPPPGAGRCITSTRRRSWTPSWCVPGRRTTTTSIRSASAPACKNGV